MRVVRNATTRLALMIHLMGDLGHDWYAAGVINGISNNHIAFLNAGGLGILVGDGQLSNPKLEKIFKA